MPDNTGDAVTIRAPGNPLGELLSFDVCVIGGGAGGISVAMAAAAFGQRVILLEKHKMGGHNVYYGGVPSQALAAIGRRAHAVTTAAQFGLSPVEPQIDAGRGHAHVQNVIAGLAPNTSIERFTGMGVRVIAAAGRFIDRSTVIAGEHRITARRFVIATGSSPAIPSIQGLADVPYLTNETLFSVSGPIAHLLIIGGNRTALELAQTYRRLGSKVTVLAADKALADHDPELTPFVLAQLRDEGVMIREGVTVTGASSAGGSVALTIKARRADGDAVEPVSETVSASHLLIAVGRTPNVADLGLDAAGIAYGKAGITVTAGLVTSNRCVFAIGDVTGVPPFVHTATQQAGVVVRRALFRSFAKMTDRPTVAVTFTDPEIAEVGLSEGDARAKHGKVNVLRWAYHQNDRAQVNRDTVGQVKVVVSGKGRILGATIVGAQASELIQVWCLAISQGLHIKSMMDCISPYPTLSEINTRTAFRAFTAVPSNPVVRKIIAWVAKLG